MPFSHGDVRGRIANRSSSYTAAWLAIVRDDEVCRHMARERASRLAGRRRDRVPLALVAEMQERHEHKREGGEGRR